MILEMLNTKPMRSKLPLLLLLALLSSCTTTRYYFVRHAERLNNSADSPLSEFGFQRAQILKDTMLNKHIDEIYVSTYIRTQQTGQPLADALSKQMIIYKADTTAELAAALKKINGKNLLLVGHSNTIPTLVGLLSGESVQIIDTHFDDLFIVKKRKSPFGQKVELFRTTYGPPSP